MKGNYLELYVLKYIGNRLNSKSLLFLHIASVGILSGFLLRAIIRKALELEYRIQRRSLLKDDFIRYVQVSNFIISEFPHKLKNQL